MNPPPVPATAPAGLHNNPLFRNLITIVQSLKATDLHLIEGELPVLRLARSCLSIPEKQALPILEHFDMLWEDVVRSSEGRHAFSLENPPHTIRITRYGTRRRRAVAFRFQPMEVPSLDRLGLDHDLLQALVDPNPGLVLITGGPCAGKTTTLASILNYQSSHGSFHIRTFEDPIEYKIRSQRSLVTQQELGIDIDNYADAVERSLGQDVNVISFGEIRDLATLRAAIKAANLNMLVYGTIHAPDVASAIGRVIEEFPESDRVEAAHSLKRCLKLVLCQNLLIHSPNSDRGAGQALLPSVVMTYQAALFKRRRSQGATLPYAAMIPDKRLRELAELFSRGHLSDGLFQHPEFPRE
ncbi:MAG: ATPase, T2SS/T4P/T4SS family [Verrucomicrobium sp.]|nr:ATPase, T2SS/T4P/T4SS family [Verrucomicrobium sp.]